MSIWLISEERGVGVVLPDWGQDEILATLPKDFIRANEAGIEVSQWVHGRHRDRKLYTFDVDKRDGSCPGRTLAACGVSASDARMLVEHLAAPAWEAEWHTMCAMYGFQPNLGGRMDAPTISKPEIDERIARALERGDLPSLEEWMAEIPPDWIETLMDSRPVRVEN